MNNIITSTVEIYEVSTRQNGANTEFVVRVPPTNMSIVGVMYPDFTYRVARSNLDTELDKQMLYSQ